MPDWTEKLKTLPHRNTGVADTSIGSTWERIPENARIVTIRRDPRAVGWSIMSKYWQFPQSAIECCNEGLDQLERYREVLSVAYEDVDRRLADIWSHCLDIPFDPTHADEMCRLNIQIKSLGVYSHG